MARKAEKQEKPKRVYRKKTEAKAPLKREPKTPYNWRKHLKPKNAPDQSTDHYEQILVETLLQKELMFAELNIWVEAFPQVLTELQQHTGEIKIEDVTYHLELFQRIMKKKFS